MFERHHWETFTQNSGAVVAEVNGRRVARVTGVTKRPTRHILANFVSKDG